MEIAATERKGNYPDLFTGRMIPGGIKKEGCRSIRSQ